MTRKRSSTKKPAAPATPAARSVRATGKMFSAKAVRETIESIAVAFILAFLFRTFEAEAFVIPTGSMAPTLLGQNKDLWCPKCGYHYQAGASSEDDQVALQRGNTGGGQNVTAVTCPLCRFTVNVDPRSAEGRKYPSYGGDRILVSKFTYDFTEPKRWDIAVFKYPGGAQTNYIKRLVGLPGETLRIWHGNLYVKPDGADEFAIEHRSPAKLKAMAQIVYDTDYVVDEMTEKGWPLRWQPWPTAVQAPQGEWKTADGGRSYEVQASEAEPRWLRYRHYAPSIDDWRVLKSGSLPAGYNVRPQLITDFYAYDTSVLDGQSERQPHFLGLHWVGDLMLECDLEVTGESGAAMLDLVKGGRHFRCELDVASGQARLSIDGVDDFAAAAQTAMHGPGRHRVAFANIDEQLTLWVDGSPVEFGGATTYHAFDNDRPRFDEQEPLDQAPAGVGARGCSIRASHIRLWRDLYYISAPDGRVVDYPTHSPLAQMSYDQLLAFWSTPAEWGSAEGASIFAQRQEAIFPLSSDQFFMLGDNSPMSQDARLWPAERYVGRDLMIGKALLIFWPHSFDKVPGTNIPFPFFPNFARMGPIR